MSHIPKAFVDDRIADALALMEERVALSVPMTVAETMKFVRAAYMRGYEDSLIGLSPENEPES